MFRKLIFLSLIVLFTPCVLAQDGITGQSPRQLVDRLNGVLLEVMKNATQLGYPGRYKKLEPVVKETYDFASIAQIAVSKHWKTLTPEQQSAFLGKLTEYSVARYASQFNGYGGEQFRFLGEESIKNSQDKTMVRYEFVIPKEPSIKFDYILSKENGRWAVINVIHDGISDLALEKAQYTSILEREGFEKLLGKLSEKILFYANKKDSDKS